MKMNYIALIPARGGSKGVPRKNVRTIAGRPLIAWSIEQALASVRLDRVIVSTDCPEIAAIAQAHGAEVPRLRPASLAQDDTSTEAVMLDAVRSWLPDVPQEAFALVLLQPTSPLRLGNRIDEAIAQFERDRLDSLVSVCADHSFFWRRHPHVSASYDFQNRPRRQDIRAEDRKYRENGSIYIVSGTTLMANRCRLGGAIGLFEMTESESYEIDSEVEFQFVEHLLRGVHHDH